MAKNYSSSMVQMLGSEVEVFRVENCVHGNPSYVVHFTEFLRGVRDIEELSFDNSNYPTIQFARKLDTGNQRALCRRFCQDRGYGGTGTCSLLQSIRRNQ